LDLREFETFPARTTVVADPAEFDLAYENIRDLKSLEIALVIQKTGEEYYCQGNVTARVSLECARCLGAFDAELTGETDFFVCEAGSRGDGDDRVIDDEDYAYLKGDSRQADIGDLVRQATILALPIKPVCREDCRGLCQSCGINLNEGSCDCSREEMDPRWQALQDLKKKMS